MMFASVPQRVDAFPFVSVGPDGSVWRRHRTAAEAQALEARSSAHRWDYLPREMPVLYNETNPILVWVRAVSSPGHQPNVARYVLDHWPATVDAALALGIIGEYTAEQAAHARLVLSRLDRVAHLAGCDH